MIKRMISVVVILLLGCSSPKLVKLSSTLISEEVILNSINDFSKTILFHKDSVFLVTVIDTFYNVENKIYSEDIVVVNIIGNSGYQYFYSPETIHLLPAKYKIIDSKLFYWWDDNLSPRGEIIEVLRKYNLLQEKTIIPEFITNDKKKSGQYYYCRKNSKKFKRIFSSKAVGYSFPPKLNCEK